LLIDAIRHAAAPEVQSHVIDFMGEGFLRKIKRRKPDDAAWNRAAI
jgi:hypothetical protein